MSQTRTVYSDKLKEALAELRPTFREIGLGLDALTTKRTELAPAFMKTWTLFQRETRRPFIAFISALDPSMPADRAAYRSHPSYRAAQYLQQLATNPEHAKRRGLTPLNMVAVTLKSFLPLCGSHKDQMEALQMILGASKWKDSDQRKLLGAIRRAKAVALPKVPRLVESSKATKAVVIAFEREKLSA